MIFSFISTHSMALIFSANIFAIIALSSSFERIISCMFFPSNAPDLLMISIIISLSIFLTFISGKLYPLLSILSSDLKVIVSSDLILTLVINMSNYISSVNLLLFNIILKVINNFSLSFLYLIPTSTTSKIIILLFLQG